MKRLAWASVLTVAAALGLTLPLSAAAQNEGAKNAYLKYCSACHGSEGKGDGVVSGFMRPKPTDLTLIAKKAGGSFPTIPTIQAIDGTTPIGPHGDSGMPVWGEIFRQEVQGSTALSAQARGKVQLIVEYLRSVQQN